MAALLGAALAEGLCQAAKGLPRGPCLAIARAKATRSGRTHRLKRHKEAGGEDRLRDRHGLHRRVSGNGCVQQTGGHRRGACGVSIREGGRECRRPGRCWESGLERGPGHCATMSLAHATRNSPRTIGSPKQLLTLTACSPCTLRPGNVRAGWKQRRARAPAQPALGKHAGPDAEQDIPLHSFGQHIPDRL